MTEAEIRADERRKVLEEVAAFVDGVSESYDGDFPFGAIRVAMRLVSKRLRDGTWEVPNG